MIFCKIYFNVVYLPWKIFWLSCSLVEVLIFFHHFLYLLKVWIIKYFSSRCNYLLFLLFFYWNSDQEIAVKFFFLMYDSLVLFSVPYLYCFHLDFLEKHSERVLFWIIYLHFFTSLQIIMCSYINLVNHHWKDFQLEVPGTTELSKFRWGRHAQGRENSQLKKMFWREQSQKILGKVQVGSIFFTQVPSHLQRFQLEKAENVHPLWICALKESARSIASHSCQNKLFISVISTVMDCLLPNLSMLFFRISSHTKGFQCCREMSASWYLMG